MTKERFIEMRANGEITNFAHVQGGYYRAKFADGYHISKGRYNLDNPLAVVRTSTEAIKWVRANGDYAHTSDITQAYLDKLIKTLEAHGYVVKKKGK